MNKLERLQKIIESKNGDSKTFELFAASFEETQEKIEKVMEEVGEMKKITPEPGYTPLKGVDYFTTDEIDSIIETIQSKVKDGKDGESIIGLPGKDGYSPVVGIDYWTKKDQEKILKDILVKIPKSKDGVSPDINEVVTQAVAELKKQPVEFKDIKGTEKLIEFLKRGGFHGGGGGLSQVYHDATLSGLGTEASPLTVVSAGGITSVNGDTGPAVTLSVAQSAIYDLEWNGTELRIPFASNTKDGFLTATDHIVFSTKVSSTSSPYSTIATDGAGTVDFNGNAYQKLALQNSVQVDMTGDIQDYDTGGGPIGGSGTTIVRVSPDASGYRLGGVQFFDPPEFNPFLIIFNTSETESFIVPHKDGGSDAKNQFSNPLLADITLSPLEALFYIYDPNVTYWRNVGRTGGSSSGVADGDYGDIAVSGGGLIWDITGNAVGNAEISDVASTKITGMIQASNVNVGMIWAINNNFFM